MMQDFKMFFLNNILADVSVLQFDKNYFSLDIIYIIGQDEEDQVQVHVEKARGSSSCRERSCIRFQGKKSNISSAL